MFENDTNEQSEIRESVRKFAQLDIPKYQLESFYNSVPLDLVKKAAGLGLTGLSVAEEFQGINAGVTTTAIVMEELAAVDLGPAIFLSVHSMVSSLISRFGSAEQKRSLLPKMARGESLGAYALTEPGAGSDASNLKASYQEGSDCFVLSGEKCYITSAGWAEVYLVFARKHGQPGADAISAFILAKDGGKWPAGLKIGPPEKKMGCELSPIASLTFENMKLPKSSLLGTLGEGYAIALAGLAGGRVNIAACANGLSRSAIDLAVKHLAEREQFGSKLIEFQGLRFMLADMRMKYEASCLLAKQAALLLERDPDAVQNRIYPSMAKCFATDATMSITTDAVQLLGGAGYIKDYKVERLMREAKMLQIVEGTNQIQRLLISREMVRVSS
ncbi:MAG: acyl-CoA dehydrogenase [Proteobacteria bacterium]|nr:MAG: acyl-CoA dehydrogenase [Pseudomonadota bacterium]